MDYLEEWPDEELEIDELDLINKFSTLHAKV